MAMRVANVEAKQVELFQYFLRHARVRFYPEGFEERLARHLRVDKSLVVSWINQTATPDAQLIGEATRVLETIVMHETEY